jgi:hypothetical protein
MSNFLRLCLVVVNLFFLFSSSTGTTTTAATATTIHSSGSSSSSSSNVRPKLREEEACGCAIGVEEYDAHRESDWWDTRKKIPFASAEDALEKMSFNNSVLVMMTNAGEVDLLDNYLCSLRLSGLNKYVVFATDEKAMKHLEYRGYNAVDGTSIINIDNNNNNAKKREEEEEGEGEEKKKTLNKLRSKDAEFGQKAWKRLTQAKLKIVEFVLKSGYDTFLTDVDIVAFQNFMPELIKTSEKNLWLRDGQEVNTGFYFMRKKSSNLNLIEAAFKRIKETHGSHDDQKVINAIMKSSQRKFLPTPEYANGCFMKTEAGRTAVANGRVKAVHVNCAQSKVVKHKIMCRRGLWFCRVPPTSAHVARDGCVKPSGLVRDELE